VRPSGNRVGKHIVNGRGFLSQMGNAFRGRKALILVRELSENLEAGG